MEREKQPNLHQENTTTVKRRRWNHRI